MARIMSARAKPTVFKYYAPQAKRVTLTGSFNEWNPKKLTAKKDSKGNWTVKVSLKPGTYEYKFIVDGSWLNDPNCTRCVPNSFGTANCLIEVT